jgi:hypothetical protein
MSQWEYRKVDLGMLPRRSTDIDLLNDLGKEGLELVNITPNTMAYLKRQLPVSAPPKSVRHAKSATAQVAQV